MLGDAFRTTVIAAAAMSKRPEIAPMSAADTDSGACALAVTRVDLTDFRNYAAVRLNVAAQPVVITGPNGAGKTNLLEALSFLAPGRGLRRAALADVSRVAAGETAPATRPWAVSVRLAAPSGPVTLGTGRAPEYGAVARRRGGAAGGERGGERRRVRIDGVDRAQTALTARLGVVWLMPEMDRLFQGGSSDRLRFLDRMVTNLDPTHADSLIGYQQAMRERSRLLQRGPGDRAWLEALEETMAANGVAIAAARAACVDRLRAAAGEAGGAFPAATLTLAGEVDHWLGAGPALSAEDRLRSVLALSRGADTAAGRALHGPHRSDLVVGHADKGMPAARCSTGEQKALLITIILAYARLQALAHGAPPLLLLDEVIAHLDAQRRAALADRICALGAQAWISGTDPALFAGFRGRAQFLRVVDATITTSGRE